LYVDWFIGSREEILTAKGDRIYNTSLDVVSNLIDTAHEIEHKILCHPYFSDGVYTIYSELYGGKLPATTQYSTSKEYATRTFDISYLTLDDFNSMMDIPIDKIALWRNNDGQTFLNTNDRILINAILNLDSVPFIQNVRGREIPTDLKETYEFLQSYRTTKAGINRGGGRAEGIVIRADDRKEIVKLRFEDYERTLGVKRK
jgi:hypothetical protein